MKGNLHPRSTKNDIIEDRLLVNLLGVLPSIGRITGAKIQLFDNTGSVICFVDEDGEERIHSSGDMSALVQRAKTEGVAFEESDEQHGTGSMCAVRLGEYVLIVSSVDRAARERELVRSLESALPLIAKVAGGEAAIFNREGQFLKAVFPNGEPDVDSLGKTYESCRRAMFTGRPHVGPSHLLPGAIAVRIPLTSYFGFGFNNSITVLKGHELLKEVRKVRTARYSWDDIIGGSECISFAIETAKKAAKTQSPVWIWGESGTGKELFAQAIHNASTRKSKPFVAVNCAALPSSLIDSTLFGYIDGAFTGARKGGQRGLFEEADGGSLLLDEISQMDLNLQAKLLRVLQEREVMRIGSTKSIPINIRVICTSNQDLRSLVMKGDFREDLFYRLNVVDVKTPPLRDRREDIPPLIHFFLARFSYQFSKLVSEIDPKAMTRLQEYDWPGNVRELENCIERAMNIAEGDTILHRHLPRNVVDVKPSHNLSQSLRKRMKEVEADIINDTVKNCFGNKSEAARRLGISYMTLFRKLRHYRQME